MKIYDVIVIGAGPAGLKAAEVLAKGNKSVLVLEKNKYVGPKVCAAGITDKDLEYIPQELIEKSFDSFLMVSGKKTRIKHNIHMIEREKLGQYQLGLAKKAGAMIKTSSFVNEIRESYIIANKKKYFFNCLIGADGSNSSVRKHLGIKSKIMAIAANYDVPDISSDVEVIFNPKKYNSWYAWIFPHKNYTSVGTGTLIGFKESRSIKKILDNFAKERNYDLKKSKFQAALINGDYCGYHFNNIYLAGDAAGLANQFTGEGIYQAMVSGEEIAKKILDKNYRCVKLNRIISKNLKLGRLLITLLKVPGLLPFCYWLGFKLIRYKMFQKKYVKTFLEY